MSKAQVATICARLIDELTKITESDTATEFALASIEKRAQAGKDEDPEQYLNVMGVVSALRRDSAATRNYFQRCLSCFGGSVMTYYSYAQSLYLLDDNFEALQFARQALSLKVTDEKVMHLERTIQDCMLDEAWENMESDTEESLTGMCQCQMVAK